MTADQLNRLLAIWIAAGQSRAQAKEKILLTATRVSSSRADRTRYALLLDEAFRAWRPAGLRRARAAARKLGLKRQLGSIDADHAIEESVDRVREKIDLYDPLKGQFGAYMAATIRHHLIGSLRANGRRVEHELLVDEPPEAPVSRLSEIERVDLADGLERLPRTDEERRFIAQLGRSVDGWETARPIESAPSQRREKALRRILSDRAIRNELRGAP